MDPNIFSGSNHIIWVTGITPLLRLVYICKSSKFINGVQKHTHILATNSRASSLCIQPPTCIKCSLNLFDIYSTEVLSPFIVKQCCSSIVLRVLNGKPLSELIRPSCTFSVKAICVEKLFGTPYLRIQFISIGLVFIEFTLPDDLPILIY